MINFYFFAYAALGKGLSGGDRIFIEFARRWSLKNKVRIYLWKEGYQMCKRQNLTNSAVEFKVVQMTPWRKMGFIVNYFARIIQGIKTGFTLKVENKPSTIIYSASEFWMDTLPAFILKKRFPKIKWIAAWYQSAPNPLKGFSAKKRKDRYRISALIYWLSQLPMKRMIGSNADFILINNEEEKKQFKKTNKDKLVVCLGAVDLDAISSFRQKKRLPKIYDAVFQGRFHPQKGVVELIEIWKKVISKRPEAILAMIGDGPLMKNVKLKIREENLEKNIKLFGYVFDGEKKYQIFMQSKVVLHPAFYDSGGMAAAEAMAFGLPGVSFDLKSLKSYYPRGMLKARNEEMDDFSYKVLLLLTNKQLYTKIAHEAKELIENHWSWDIRAEQILNSINK